MITRNISGFSIMCNRKPIRYKIAKAQPVTSLTFMVISGFFLHFHRRSDWLKNNKNLINIPEIIHSVHFLWSYAVKLNKVTGKNKVGACNSILSVETKLKSVDEWKCRMVNF